MRLFKRKTKSAIDQFESISIGTRIGRGIVKLQTEFAVRLNLAAAGLSAKKLKMNLVLFCLASGGLSLYLAINGLLGSNTAKNAITIDHALVPKHFNRSGDEVRDVQNIIDETLYQQVRTFRAYMDSLHMNDKKTFDSITLSRPGLMDSVHAIEEIYLSQQIK